ncbi:hypothetical protein JST97_06265 [bacterium]|nr:hypothetical protein [bacterium]
MRRRHLLLTLALFPLNAMAQRNPKPAFKGMELYSWPDHQSWRYALLPGTNRNKHWSEILAAGVDEASLKKKLAELAVNEVVFWQATCSGGVPTPLAFPPSEKVSEIEQLCGRLHIQLELIQGVPKANQ